VKERNIMEIICFQLHLLFVMIIYMLNTLLCNYFPYVVSLWAMQEV